MNNNHRIKILLVKHDVELSNKELIRIDESKYHSKQLDDMDKTILFYRYTGGNPPRWYRKYLMQNDKELLTRYALGLIFRNIEYDGKNRRFAIAFGGADAMLNLQYFEPRFGLKIALNLADKIFSISKSSISTTMASIKETAVQDQELSDFIFDMEEDLLKGVVVKPKHKKLSNSNIRGNIGLSISTPLGFSSLDNLLEKCMDEYARDDYKTDYSFLDNIIEIDQKSDLIEMVFKIILEDLKAKDVGHVWFAPLDEVEWDYVESYSFYKRKLSKQRISSLPSVFSINYDSIYDYLKNDIAIISDLKDLHNYKISINTTDDRYDDKKWDFFDCMYASVSFDDKHYVLSEGHLYQIKKDLYDNYQKDYAKLKVFQSLQDGIKNQHEREYLENTCKNNSNLLLMDLKLVYKGRGKYEPCDIFNTENNSFIHVKRYGSSKILSHLFAQAAVSANLFMNDRCRRDIIDKMNQLVSVMQKTTPTTSFDDIKYSDCTVIMAIITEKDIPQTGKANIPFFSMINVVRTAQQIKDWGYKDAGIMFIKAL